MRKIKFIKGITIIEIMIIVGFLVGLSSLVMFSFSDLNKKQSLDKNVENILSVFDETRSLALSSKDFSDYGIKLSTTSLVYFKGSSFALGLDKKEYFIDKSITFNFTLSSTTDEIIFKKVTGETENSGLLSFNLLSEPSNIKKIEIYKTGVLEIK